MSETEFKATLNHHIVLRLNSYLKKHYLLNVAVLSYCNAVNVTFMLLLHLHRTFIFEKGEK